MQERMIQSFKPGISMAFIDLTWRVTTCYPDVRLTYITQRPSNALLRSPAR